MPSSSIKFGHIRSIYHYPYTCSHLCIPFFWISYILCLFATYRSLRDPSSCVIWSTSGLQSFCIVVKYWCCLWKPCCNTVPKRIICIIMITFSTLFFSVLVAQTFFRYREFLITQSEWVNLAFWNINLRRRILSLGQSYI